MIKALKEWWERKWFVCKFTSKSKRGYTPYAYGHVFTSHNRASMEVIIEKYGDSKEEYAILFESRWRFIALIIYCFTNTDSHPEAIRD